MEYTELKQLPGTQLGNHAFLYHHGPATTGPDGFAPIEAHAIPA